MKTLLAICVAMGVVASTAIAAAAPASGDAPALQQAQVVAPVHRANLYVRDIGASLARYHDILKLQVAPIAPGSRPMASTPGCGMRAVVLSAGDDRGRRASPSTGSRASGRR